MRAGRQVFLQLIREACQELGYSMRSMAQDWLIRIQHRERVQFIVGYNFGLNPDASAKLCQDKSATASVLADADLPHVPHQLFHNRWEYAAPLGQWPDMQSFLARHQQIVIKPNEGSSGQDVFRIDQPTPMEQVVYQLFQKYPSISFSPYVPIQEEYRLLVLDQVPRLVYRKQRPQLEGDGQQKVWELLAAQQLSLNASILQVLAQQNISPQQVLEAGETVVLNWKHNLSEGAKAISMAPRELPPDAIELALQATQALGIRMASVDLIRTHLGDFRVLEVNAGIMLVNFARSSQQAYQLARSTYQLALQRMMESVQP